MVSEEEVMKGSTLGNEDTIRTSGIRYYQHYDVKTEIVKINHFNTTNMRSAYSKEGDYIGSAILAHRLVNVYGIHKFEKIDFTDNECSIGFSPLTKKWYGWNDKTLRGFSVGSRLKTARAINMVQAKRMAITFARTIS